MAAIIIGLSLGAEIDVVSYLTNRYFGVRNYAVIYSVLYSMSSVGSAGGIYLAGLIHDTTGSYSQAMLLCITAAVGSAILLLSMGQYPSFSEQESIDSDAATKAAEKACTTGLDDRSSA